MFEQASTVRFAIQLVWALQNADERELRAILEGRRITLGPGNQVPTLAVTELSGPLTVSWDIGHARPLHETSTEAGDTGQGGYWGSYMVALGPRQQVLFHLTPSMAEGDTSPAVVRHAKELVAHLVNANTEGVRLTLGCVQGHFEWRLTARALIEAIWHHVGTMAVRAHTGDSRWVRLCEECGTPFLVTDRRQRFCPPDYGSKQSRCGARARWRRTQGKEGSRA